MIIYRPHRGQLVDAMSEAKEFNSFEDMKQYIYNEWNIFKQELFTIDDIVIDESHKMNDERNGWKDTMHVCIKRCGEEDYIKLYGCPQCIGMCATDYSQTKI